MSKKLQITLEIFYPEKSRPIDEGVIIHAIKDYLDSVSGFYYNSIDSIKLAHWENWEEEEDD